MCDDIKVVFRGTVSNAEFVRMILRDADILSFLEDEVIGTMAPWYAAPEGAGAVKVIVSAADEEKALSALRDAFTEEELPPNPDSTTE